MDHDLGRRYSVLNKTTQSRAAQKGTVSTNKVVGFWEKLYLSRMMQQNNPHIPQEQVIAHTPHRARYSPPQFITRGTYMH
jgi:hypothetical protein